jgi:hypothetical protein
MTAWAQVAERAAAGARKGALPWAGASVRATVAAGPSRGEWAGWAVSNREHSASDFQFSEVFFQ